MRRATLKSRAASATDEPPYFCTTSSPLTEAPTRFRDEMSGYDSDGLNGETGSLWERPAKTCARILAWPRGARGQEKGHNMHALVEHCGDVTRAAFRNSPRSPAGFILVERFRPQRLALIQIGSPAPSALAAPMSTHLAWSSVHPNRRSRSNTIRSRSTVIPSSGPASRGGRPIERPGTAKTRGFSPSRMLKRWRIVAILSPSAISLSEP